MHIPISILGATGSVGQKFVELLADHPWFEITALAASERSQGKSYKEAVNWFMTKPLPPHIAKMEVLPCDPSLLQLKPNNSVQIAFSGLDSSVAGEIETKFAQAGHIVISNSRNHRMDEDVPLLVPEINADHLELIKEQKYPGKIVTNPNCSTIGLVIALKPLLDKFGLEMVNVVTMQAISGAGYPGVPSLDILDNVIPSISGEEGKMQTETLKIFGKFFEKKIINLDLKVSASCNRVAVLDGHMECVSVKLKKKAAMDEIISAWEGYSAEPQKLSLPLAPLKPIHYFREENYPQPKLHRNIDKGMAVSIGRLRECPIFDYKFVVLSHNTIRGAAGGAILNAELMLKQGYIKV